MGGREPIIFHVLQKNCASLYPYVAEYGIIHPLLFPGIVPLNVNEMKNDKCCEGRMAFGETLPHDRVAVGFCFICRFS